MKTAVSIPDELFKVADKLAARLGVSRSGLYARALADFVARQRDSVVTDKLNEVYATEDSTVDPVLEQAQRRTLPSDDEWT